MRVATDTTLRDEISHQNQWKRRANSLFIRKLQSSAHNLLGAKNYWSTAKCEDLKMWSMRCIIMNAKHCTIWFTIIFPSHPNNQSIHNLQNCVVICYVLYLSKTSVYVELMKLLRYFSSSYFFSFHNHG